MEKICIITRDIKAVMTNYASLGGEAVVLYNFIKELLNRRYNITIFTLPGTYIDVDGCNVIELPISLNDTDILCKLKNILSKYSFDKIFSMMSFILYGRCFLQSHSIIHRIKNSIFPVNLLNIFLRKKMLEKQKNEYEKYDASVNFIAVSEIIKKDYSKNFKIKDSNIEVAYLGCNRQYETLPNEEKKPYITIGMVANLSINKRGYLFLFIMGILKWFGYNYKIKIIAPKFDKDILMKFPVKFFGLKDRMEILPKQSDMTNFYKNIDCLVLASWNEAFGLVVLEAMSFGEPCIVSSSAGVAEIISVNNGFIFKRNSIIDLVNKLKKIINIYNNDFEKFKLYKINSFETSKKYNWENFVNNILK